MFEDNRWRRMLKPGITAIVGAGGKTTVLERLGTYGHGGHLPIMVSSIFLQPRALLTVSISTTEIPGFISRNSLKAS